MHNEPREPLLKIASYHRSESDAREYVGQIAARLRISNFKSKLACDKSVAIPTSGKPLIANLRTEVRQARITGIPPAMQGLIDNSDRLMPPVISLGASMGGIAKISVSLGSHTASIDGDGILEPPVGVLADDVLYYRREAVSASTKHDLAQIARAYRIYLQVCISLVDAFLGHATFALKETDPKIASSEHFRAVQSMAPFADRIDACADFGRTRLNPFGKPSAGRT